METYKIINRITETKIKSQHILYYEIVLKFLLNVKYEMISASELK